MNSKAHRPQRAARFLTVNWAGFVFMALLIFPAVAGASFRIGTYRGPTSQQHTMLFGASATRLRNIDTVVYSACLFPSGGTHELHRVRVSGIAIRHGRFSKNLGVYDGGTATIAGRISGSKAHGTVDLSYTESRGFGSDTTIGRCRGSMKWSATWKRHGVPPGIPPFQPIAKPNAEFKGTNADGVTVDFLTSSGQHEQVLGIVAGYSYSCGSGATGQLVLRSGSDGATINQATGFFDYSQAVPVTTTSGDRYQADFSFGGYFGGSGRKLRAASGNMQVSFTTSAGDYCIGDNAAWTAHTP